VIYVAPAGRRESGDAFTQVDVPGIIIDEEQLGRKLTAEALGTAILVFFGAGAATLMFGFRFAGLSTAAGVVATALAFGLVLLALVYTIGPVSGCHLNPAVTLGAFLAGRIKLVEAGLYWVAQFAGGIIGALLLWAVVGQSPFYSRSRTGLGADGWGSASQTHISLGGAFLTEVILTAIFVFIILSVTGKTGNPVVAGLVIGLSLTVIHIVGIPLTGTSVNPARSLGPAVILGGQALNQVWLFIVAPLVGGVTAAVIDRVVNRESKTTAGLPRQLAPEATGAPSTATPQQEVR
jgi:aquaporin Z